MGVQSSVCLSDGTQLFFCFVFLMDISIRLRRASCVIEIVAATEQHECKKQLAFNHSPLSKLLSPQLRFNFSNKRKRQRNAWQNKNEYKSKSRVHETREASSQTFLHNSPQESILSTREKQHKSSSSRLLWDSVSQMKAYESRDSHIAATDLATPMLTLESAARSTRRDRTSQCWRGQL